MKPGPRFYRCDKIFWAYVRLLSQEIGYTQRETHRIKTYRLQEMVEALNGMGLGAGQLVGAGGIPTVFARQLMEYFDYRAEVLNTKVEPLLMDKSQARKEFERLKMKFHPASPLPMNKQKGKMKAPAYLTGIVNMLIEANKGRNCVDYDPRSLTVATKNGAPIHTFCRRIDGCFPSLIDPVAVWEIKEYYNTTTFGSRVADGIYETILDGLEILELRKHEKINIKHYLIIDDHYTWWDCGRSYLCRIIDLLNMGFVDEVLFGKEVLTRLPALVKEWKKEKKKL